MLLNLRERIRRRSVPRGFTLLELIIVLFVLATLAALVVPTIGFIRKQAEFSSKAAGAAEVLNNLELYRASTGNYPNRLDTLVNTDGTVYSGVYLGFPYGTVTSGFTPGYYLANGGGITELVNHDDSATNPNDSSQGTPAVPTSSFSGPAASFCVIDPSAVDSSSPSFPKLERIVRAAYPNQVDASSGTTSGVAIPEGHQLVCLGVGSRAACVGTTMTSAPIDVGAEDSDYGRYIAVFDVSQGPTGRGKVQLKLVLDSQFEVLAKNIENYEGHSPQDEEAVFEDPDDPPATP